MKTRIFLSLFISLLTLSANAYDFMVDGIAYNKNSDGNSVTVTYTTFSKPSTSNYSSYIGNVVIPSTVTNNGITYLVTDIGDNAFYYCNGLTSVTIPSSVASIGELAFWQCSITSVSIPNSVTTIKYAAFANCIRLASVDIGNNVSTIGFMAFQGCKALTNVNIPNSVTSIEPYAFDNCTNLTTISIPTSVTSIGNGAFSGTPWFENQPNGLVYAGLVAYQYKGSMPYNTQLAIKEGTKGIAMRAFESCENLTNITIPNSVTFIGVSSFRDCSGLSKLTIPNSVTFIGNYAFSGCSKLYSINIPNSLTSIEEGTFSGCSTLTESLIIPNSVTSIGNYAFSGCSALTGSLIIPNSVTSIGNNAFSGCSALTGSLTIPNTVTSLGERAFKGCSGFLGTLTLSNSLSSIEEETFFGCDGFTGSLIIPNSVTSIGERAFEGCCNFTGSLIIPNSVTSIGERAFKGCSNFTGELILPNTLNKIKGYSFSECNELNTVIIPNSVTVIEEGAFSGCDLLETLTIGNSVSTIADRAFFNCTKIRVINSLNEQPPRIYSDTFWSYLYTYPTLYVPSSSVNTYKEALYWKKFTKIYSYGTVPITSISFNWTDVGIKDGQSKTLIVTIYPSNATNKNLIWKSSDNNIATVDNYGTVTGVSEGTATITATTTDGSNLSAVCRFYVTMTAKSISLNKSTLTLNDGQSESLVATVTPNNTSNKSVTWKSSNTAVATVTTSGKVTGVAPGTATITATTADGSNISASCQVTVKMLAKGISLNKSSLTLNDGQAETLVATITPSNTSNKSVTWKSSNTAVATVTTSGKVTGVAPGTATITATTADGSNISTSCQVTVKMLAKGISLNKSSLTLINGQTEMLVATVTPSNTTNKSVTWTSSNNSVATVDANGYVTAISLGTATITATTTDGTNLSASCQVSIGISAQEISLNKNVLSLYDGQSETLVATIFPSNATNKIVLWRSSNTNIAIVDNNGNVTGVAAGTATITATTTDGTNLSASCQVNVLTKAKGISLNKSSLTLNDGQTATLVATVTPSNASNKVVTWHSSDTDIATVDANGKVTAIEPGTVNITATTTDGTNLSATCQVTVYMKAKGISLNKATLSLEKGQTETLVATITPSNTSDKSLTWHSSNTSVVTVDSYGNVTGVGDGTATITATTNDGTYLSASCQVTVTVKATGIRLSSSSITIDEEKSTTLYATITPYNTANQKVTWTSANPNIATVDSYGRVTGVAFGETTIIATTSDGTNLSDSCQVTVVVKKLYSETIDFFGGEEVTIPVKMRNSMEISGFQTEIYLPNEFSFAMDEDRIPEISLSDRASRNHTIAATSLSDTNKAIRVLSYSNTSKEYNGNDGDLFYFTLKSDWDTPIDTYYVTLDNSKLAKPDGEQLNIDGTSIKLRCFYVPGDANHDKKVSISDIIADARYILLQNPEPFHYKSANVNDDREISVADIVLTSNIILGRYQTDDKKYSVQRLMGNNSLSASVVESRRDGSRTIAIALDNTSDYTAFQADMVLPNGMEIINARLSDRAGRSHTVSMNRIGGNSVRLLSYATDNAVFAGNSGELLFLDVKGSGDIDMTNALFCEPNGCEHELDNISFSTELSGISDITVGNGPINVYNMAGQLLRKNVNEENATQNLPAGIYLVGNKKVVVK